MPRIPMLEQIVKQCLHVFQHKGLLQGQSAWITCKLHRILQVLSHFFNTFTLTPLLSFFK